MLTSTSTVTPRRDSSPAIPAGASGRARSEGSTIDRDAELLGQAAGHGFETLAGAGDEHEVVAVAGEERRELEPDPLEVAPVTSAVGIARTIREAGVAGEDPIRRAV